MYLGCVGIAFQVSSANLGAPGSTRMDGEPGRSQSRGGESLLPRVKYPGIFFTSYQSSKGETIVPCMIGSDVGCSRVAAEHGKAWARWATDPRIGGGEGANWATDPRTGGGEEVCWMKHSTWDVVKLTLVRFTPQHVGV